MERNVIWSPWDEPGLEHLHLMQSENENGIAADGLILRVKDRHPFRAHYKIYCDHTWRVQAVEISLLSAKTDSIRLHTDGRGEWTDGTTGKPIPWLKGCIDADISITAFTNTLPIRRLGLKPGDSSALAVVYIAVPEMEVKRAAQRYTCLELSTESGLYNYADEGLFPGYTVNMSTDADGVVVDYPGLFRRVWSSGSLSAKRKV